MLVDIGQKPIPRWRLMMMFVNDGQWVMICLQRWFVNDVLWFRQRG